MDDSARDYYDIPVQWIPSSNFANRPASEISEINLDGLWTFMSSSDSSAPPSETDDDQTPTSRETPKWTRRENDATILAPQPRSSMLSHNGKASDSPVMRGKAATAPAGGFNTPNYAPQPPRRAVSARLGPSRTIRGRKPQREDPEVDPLTVVKTPLQAHLGPDKPLPSLPVIVAPIDSNPWGNTKVPGSFSRRVRVKKTLDDKNMGRLNMDIVDFESRGLLSSPRSMMNTPRELYAIPEKRATLEEPSSPISPHAKDARRSILFSLSGKGLALHLKKPSQYWQHNDALKLYPEGWKATYLPGTICLEKHPAQLRKDSVASLDPFAKEVEPRVRRHSDLIVLDRITAFFDDLGVLEDATEVCLDMFWRDVTQAPYHVANTRASSIVSVEEPALKSLESLQSAPSALSLRGSKFSFSSASSSMSVPRNGTPMRQRDRLKRLFSPAFPGAAFLRTSAAPKEQDSKSDMGSTGDATSVYSSPLAQRRDR
jgi:hypothetical protein